MLTNKMISVEHCLESILRQARRFRANISVRGREVVVSDGSYHGWDCNSSWYSHFRNYWLIAEWPYFTCVKSTVTWVSTTPIPHMSDDFPMHHRPVQINIGFNRDVYVYTSLVLISKFQLRSKVMSHVDLTFHSNQHLLTLGTRKLNSTPECETTCYRYSFHNDSQVKFRCFIPQFITICFTVVLCWLTYNLGNLHLNIKNL